MWQMLAILTMVYFGTVNAQVYRCTVDQQTVFQDHPCGSVNTSIASPNNDSTGLRDAEKTWIQQNKSKRPATSSKSRQPREKNAETKACWKKRQQLKDVKRRLKQGYKASEGDKLKRERAKYQDFLKRFCQD